MQSCLIRCVLRPVITASLHLHTFTFFNISPLSKLLQWPFLTSREGEGFEVMLRCFSICIIILLGDKWAIFMSFHCSSLNLLLRMVLVSVIYLIPLSVFCPYIVIVSLIIHLFKEGWFDKSLVMYCNHSRLSVTGDKYDNESNPFNSLLDAWNIDSGLDKRCLLKYITAIQGKVHCFLIIYK